MSVFVNFLDLFVVSAPWLLLGFFMAGLFKSFIPEDFLSRHLGSNSRWATVKAALIGAPLPLCSCGVVPAAMGLRKAGASKNATVSFLVATPETGVDSVAVSYAMLGPFMAIIRPVAAVFSAIIAGILVGYAEDTAPEPDETKSCCATKAKPSCCGGKKPSLSGRLKEGVSFSFGKMLRDIIVWLLAGLLFAAMVKTWVPDSLLAEWGSSWYAFMAMALVGVPMYICATASTPIAAGLLMSGISPGAVLVFMMAGPATNIGTVGIIRKELGGRAVLAYLSGVIISSFAFGYLCNRLVSVLGIDVIAQAPMDHAMTYPLVGYASAVVFGLLVVRALYQKALPLFSQKTKTGHSRDVAHADG